MEKLYKIVGDFPNRFIRAEGLIPQYSASGLLIIYFPAANFPAAIINTLDTNSNRSVYNSICIVYKDFLL